ncbi:MAG: hypothetical protein ABJ251_22705 [Paracoccaceae bacterium]
MTSHKEVTSKLEDERHSSFGPFYSMYLKTRAVGMRGAGKFGMAMIVLAFAVWFAPESVFPAMPKIFKLFASLSFGFLGLAFWQSVSNLGLPSVEIDTIRREVKLMRGFGKTRHVAGEYKFKDLAQAERVGNQIRLWGNDGTILVDVEMRDPAKLNSLVSGLRDEGKLI